MPIPTRQASPEEWATSLISGFAAHLRKEGKAPPFPIILAAIEQAQRLASLRGRSLPLRDDIIDAVRSTFIKEEITRGGTPLLAELHLWLTGNAIGDVPARHRLSPAGGSRAQRGAPPALCRGRWRHAQPPARYLPQARAPRGEPLLPRAGAAGGRLRPSHRRAGFPQRCRARPPVRSLVGRLVANGRGAAGGTGGHGRYSTRSRGGGDRRADRHAVRAGAGPQCRGGAGPVRHRLPRRRGRERGGSAATGRGRSDRGRRTALGRRRAR